MARIRWDDLMFTGSHGDWSWLVVRACIKALPDLVTTYHPGQRLCITAFDSGAISPSPEEVKLGWSLIGQVMVSPPLTRDIEIPCDQDDEWYVFESLPPSINVTDRYVNYGGFNLAEPRELAASQDSTWDRANFDWLIPIQEQFWTDIDRLKPSSYIASGDVDVVVTRDPVFFTHASDAARLAIEHNGDQR